MSKIQAIILGLCLVIFVLLLSLKTGFIDKQDLSTYSSDKWISFKGFYSIVSGDISLETSFKDVSNDISHDRIRPDSKIYDVSSSVQQRDVTDEFIIPGDAKLRGMSNEEAIGIYWRYANNLQVLCRNQTRMGTFKDGGKETCIDNDFIPKKPCIVYSFGSAFKFDFEEAVHRAFGCEIHTFDPTMNLNEENKKNLPEFLIFHKTGLAGKNYVTSNDWPMSTLEKVMKDLGHVNKPIDILKIDIEGWEYPALDHALKAGTMKWIKQLLIEIHFNGDGKHADKLRTLRKLYEQGFRIFMRDRNPVLIYPINSELNTHYTPLVEFCFINMNYRT